MREVRKIKKDELLQSNKIAAVAYQYSYHAKADENILYPQAHEDHYGAFDDNGDMMARAVVNHHQIYFDGHIVESAGIGGVATLPEYRHQRSVRNMLACIFEEMQAKKQYISQLYPFNFAYYRKFGYEAVYEQLHLKMPFSLLNERDDIVRNNRCKLIEDNQHADLRHVYEQYASAHNNAHKRDDRLWEIKLSGNIYGKMHYPYVYYDENGEPSGYFLFTRDDGFKIMELCYQRPADLKGILGFIKNFAADYDSLRFTGVPADEDFTLLFADQFKIERHVSFAGMTCIAHIAKVFELMRYPQDSGCFSVAVSDTLQMFNAGVYHIAYKDGKIADIEQKPLGSTAADMDVTHTTLSKLICGTDHLNAHRYRFQDGLRINGNRPTLEKVFVKKRMYLSDFF